jgi:hypothetical protein
LTLWPGCHLTPPSDYHKSIDAHGLKMPGGGGQGFLEKLPGGSTYFGLYTYIAFLLTSFSKNCLGVLFHTPLTPHQPLRASMHKSIKVFIKFWSREQGRKYFWPCEKQYRSQKNSISWPFPLLTHEQPDLDAPYHFVSNLKIK